MPTPEHSEMFPNQIPTFSNMLLPRLEQKNIKFRSEDIYSDEPNQFVRISAAFQLNRLGTGQREIYGIVTFCCPECILFLFFSNKKACMRRKRWKSSH